jgi:hypothetical protein
LHTAGSGVPLVRSAAVLVVALPAQQPAVRRLACSCDRVVRSSPDRHRRAESTWVSSGLLAGSSTRETLRWVCWQRRPVERRHQLARSRLRSSHRRCELLCCNFHADYLHPNRRGWAWRLSHQRGGAPWPGEPKNEMRAARVSRGARPRNRSRRS